MTVRHEDTPTTGSLAKRRRVRSGEPPTGMPRSQGKRQGRAVNWDDAITDAAASDTGMRRSNNQDSFTIVRASSAETWRQRGHLFIVADGMGAHAVGELASKLACDNIPHNYMKTKAGAPAEAIVKAYRDVGSIIHAKASANKDFQGMGTTCSTLLLLPEGAVLAHVGDSRIYRIRKSRIDQLTFDHSLVWELVRRHHLQPDEANLRVPKNVITRSLGPDPSVEVDIEGPLAVEPNDVYLLCSDGLSGLVSDPELGAIAGNFHPKEACRYLVQLANLRGGHDNVTVVILRIGSWVEPDSAQDVPTQSSPADNGRTAGGFKSVLAGLFRGKGRAQAPEPVEEHLYRTADCPVSEALVDKLGELTRKVQAAAVEQAWSLDWTALTTFRRKETEARSAGNLRGALKYSGEIIELLGKAARFHRKAGGPAGVT
ncbi:MAG: protein phosphatase 2C domain-containing protein [Isosphaeraceae bacterium]|nr:protein phosphatase 2C domain-containing protein [Isosphaeraceae bacterium]